MEDTNIAKCLMTGELVDNCLKEQCIARPLCIFSNAIENTLLDTRKTNLEKLVDAEVGRRREMLMGLFSKWAGIGDSYIYDLTRVKEGFAVGTVTLDDFSEWDEERVGQLVDELLEWMMRRW